MIQNYAGINELHLSWTDEVGKQNYLMFGISDDLIRYGYSIRNYNSDLKSNKKNRISNIISDLLYLHFISYLDIHNH